MPTIDIDRETAHELAQRELAKPIYPKTSLMDRIGEWIEELLYKIMVKGSSIPGGWLTLTVLAIVVVVALIVAVRIARRTMRTNRGKDIGLFGIHELSAAEHRATAEAYAAQGNWAAAIRHRLRAVGRQLEETGMLNPVPGRTANELARDAGELLPAFSSELRRAATVFNDVTYGEQPGTEPNYRLVADLDDTLRRHAAPSTGDPGAPAVPDTWVPLR
ncbi:hypothetical protein FHT40_001127 [Mycolicibacterium sp. BK556]|uniref:DUF4129 domain-containing protein n=1 Tax=unclassified Mycolicibacterium TaxID=2636767 RepID=UPI001614117C|nr:MULTISPECIES: DUF4129 domain-containing protein [unclassified Mycolicibacterium]MBB3601494.1 hypothetical protein [Mycolicibacterium sp. BK556]MBB3631246.1 hypothetical protein [Mycolicibacterium sp. BK607]MBB3749250.1 hypothetical protein [Mycolicibacterium sp. BK634]